MTLRICSRYLFSTLLPYWRNGADRPMCTLLYLRDGQMSSVGSLAVLLRDLSLWLPVVLHASGPAPSTLLRLPRLSRSHPPPAGAPRSIYDKTLLRVPRRRSTFRGGECYRLLDSLQDREIPQGIQYPENLTPPFLNSLILMRGGTASPNRSFLKRPPEPHPRSGFKAPELKEKPPLSEIEGR